MAIGLSRSVVGECLGTATVLLTCWSLQLFVASPANSSDTRFGQRVEFIGGVAVNFNRPYRLEPNRSEGQMVIGEESFSWSATPTDAMQQIPNMSSPFAKDRIARWLSSSPNMVADGNFGFEGRLVRCSDFMRCIPDGDLASFRASEYGAKMRAQLSLTGGAIDVQGSASPPVVTSIGDIFLLRPSSMSVVELFDNLKFSIVDPSASISDPAFMLRGMPVAWLTFRGLLNTKQGATSTLSWNEFGSTRIDTTGSENIGEGFGPTELGGREIAYRVPIPVVNTLIRTIRLGFSIWGDSFSFETLDPLQLQVGPGVLVQSASSSFPIMMSPVPEPKSYTLMLIGMSVLVSSACAMRRGKFLTDAVVSKNSNDA